MCRQIPSSLRGGRSGFRMGNNPAGGGSDAVGSKGSASQPHRRHTIMALPAGGNHAGKEGQAGDKRTQRGSLLPEQIEKAALALMGPKPQKKGPESRTPEPTTQGSPQKQETQPPIFGHLPLILVCRIFALLSAKELCVCAMVCQEFSSLSSIENIWATKALDEIVRPDLFNEMLHENASLHTPWKKLYRKYKFRQDLKEEKQFARAVYDYHPRGEHELAVTKDEILRVVCPEKDGSVWCLVEPLNVTASTADGNVPRGWVPSGYLEEIPRKYLQKKDRTPEAKIPAAINADKEIPGRDEEQEARITEKMERKQKRKEHSEEKRRMRQERRHSLKEKRHEEKKEQRRKTEQKREDTKQNQETKEHKSSVKPEGTDVKTDTEKEGDKKPGFKMVRAMFDYMAAEDNELGFRKYDLMNFLGVDRSQDLSEDGTSGESTDWQEPPRTDNKGHKDLTGLQSLDSGKYKHVWLKVSLTRRTPGGGTMTAVGRVPEDVEYVSVLCDYEGCSEYELSLKKGQRVAVLERDAERGWIYAQSLGLRGWIPENYVTDS